MERVIVTVCLMKNAAVGFFQGNAQKVIEDAKALKPTIFLGVPRIYQRIYEVIQSGINKASGVKKIMVDKAVASKLDALNKNGYLTHPVWDRLVFNNMKNALGEKVRFMMTGSAPIDPKMLQFLKIAFCCPILQGYGQTESCCGATNTVMQDFTIGHVGGPSASCEIKLVDVPSINYLTTDKNDE